MNNTRPNLANQPYYQEISIQNHFKCRVIVDKKGHNEEVHMDKTRYALCKIGELNMSNGSKAKQTNILNLDAEARVLMIGVVKCKWSHDSRFVAVISQNMDRIVWIWDMKYLVYFIRFCRINNR
eukprot:820043_1